MKLCIFSAAGLVLSATGLMAQIAAQPAELPPASFDGGQFADSTGCVFSRIGVDGDVRWVPRVNRKRQQICGQTPSFGATPVTLPDGSPVIAAGQEVEIVVPQIEVGSEPGQAPTAPAEATEAGVLPGATAEVAPPATPAKAKVTVSAAPGPVIAAAPRPKARASSATGRADPSLAGTVVTPADADMKGVSRATRVLPRQVYDAQEDLRPVVLPPGYKNAWSDGRLNPRRAEQTLGGHEAMTSLWSRSVPMREQER